MKAEVLTGPERRRRWSADEKARIVGEMLAPGAEVAAIARRHGVSRSLVYGWRRELRQVPARDPVLPDLVPVIVASSAGPSAREHRKQPGGIIEIRLACGIRITVRGQVDGEALRAVVAALRPA